MRTASAPEARSESGTGASAGADGGGTAVPVSVPFADTRARDLVWTLDRPPLPALATRTVGPAGAGAGIAVELRVLGASHQVVLADGPQGSMRVVETVACLPGTDGHLPGSAAPDVPGLASYAFTSAVDRFSGPELDRRVRALVDRLHGDPAAVAAAFPGSPSAVTALAAASPAPGCLEWRTWHAYPQTGELVRTRTRTRVAPVQGTAPHPSEERSPAP
ncbi:DUF2617 family protein [Nocardiopsis sp. RSe5-2]|uniref:DUF2617 family protein n=1 Tax=Nocardiopsis endophytica TaxID=3018445 RepID=A0ABT4TXB9_9ACTN|nr:DUF2617 family protein [Nocardiopsis endophytica]MDA2809340.1 DUF2617 family protein [Nocardiopsis endophytica]